MPDQEPLVQDFQRSQQELEGAVAGLDEDAATRVWYGRWGVREIVAHITGWEAALAEALGKIAHGERPSAEGINLSDVEGTNDRFAEDAARKRFSQVLSELRSATGRVEEAIRALPADRLEEGKTARRLVDTLIRHPAEHIEAIRSWRASGGSGGTQEGGGSAC